MNSRMLTAPNHDSAWKAVVEDRFLRPQEVWKMAGIGRSTFYAMQQSGTKQYDETFPLGYQLGGRTRVWSMQEVCSWIKSKKPAVAGETGVHNDVQ